MIYLFYTVFSTITTAAYYCFIISHKIGQVIVITTNDLVVGSYHLVINIIAVLRVILEDFNYFVKDVTSACQSITGFLVNTGISIYVGVVNLITIAHMFIEWIFSTCIGFVTAVLITMKTIFVNIQQIIVFMKQSLVLFGSGIWFALTLIPLSAVYFCTLITYFTGSLMEELYNFIYNIFGNITDLCYEIYAFVTDVPFEAIAGLCAVICIIYLIAVFHMVFIRYMSRSLVCLSRKLHHVIHKGYNYLLSKIHYLVNSVNILNYQNTCDTATALRPSDSARTLEDARFCVICQERLKCVLTLPCRHVCLCSECNIRLKAVNNTCPLCRKRIEKSMKVFI